MTAAVVDQVKQLKAAYKAFRAMGYDEYRLTAERVASGDSVDVRVADGWLEPGDDEAIFKEKIEIRHIRDGFYHLPNPFVHDVGLLRRLAAEAVRDWPVCSGAHRTNLDIEAGRPDSLLESCQLQLSREPGLTLRSTWLHRLRWTSLGAQYNWSARRYDIPPAPDAPPPLPASLARLAARLVALTGAWPAPYAGQAGIVNYYHPGHSMCFHVDEAEPYREAPLVSLSLGLSAGYLLAGPAATASTAATLVTPLLLIHGDVVVMTGDSRLAYHAVARVFPDSGCSDNRWSAVGRCFCDRDAGVNCPDPARCQLLWDYLQDTRININVRQVLPSGQDWDLLRTWRAE